MRRWQPSLPSHSEWEKQRSLRPSASLRHLRISRLRPPGAARLSRPSGATAGVVPLEARASRRQGSLVLPPTPLSAAEALEGYKLIAKATANCLISSPPVAGQELDSVRQTGA